MIDITAVMPDDPPPTEALKPYETCDSVDLRCSSGPLIVQSSLTVLLETDAPLAHEAKIALNQFAELVKSPEHVHTYQITPLSLWNAMASGIHCTIFLDVLHRHKKFDFPPAVDKEIQALSARYGQIQILRPQEAGHTQDNAEGGGAG